MLDTVEGFIYPIVTSRKNISSSRVWLIKTITQTKCMTRNLHVVQNRNGWAVKAEKIAQPLSKHYTQANAIAKATELARANNVELLIHGRDGRIRERNSFGNDPFPPRG